MELLAQQVPAPMLPSVGTDSGGARTSTGRSNSIVPRIDINETWTDNLRLSTGSKQSDFVTEIAPGVRAESRAGRLIGSVDYSLRQFLYARESESNSLQHSLNANGRWEAVDKWLFVDGNATISRQAISAFGPQSIDNGTINSNATEVTMFRLSPYARGQLGGFANYEVRQTWTSSRSKSELGSDADTVESQVRLSRYGTGPLGWTVDATRQRLDYSLGQASQSRRLRSALTYKFDPQWDASLIIGREANNYGGVGSQSFNNTGLSANWAPSERTKVFAEYERRFFGNAHRVLVTHRWRRSAFQYSDSRDIATFQGVTNSVIGTLYDVLFFQFASIEPDPVARAQLVRAYLLNSGLNANAPVIGGFLNSSVSVSRSQQFAYTLTGVRDTVALTFNRNTSEQVTRLLASNDDFASSPLIRQTGWNLSYSRRLSPDTSVSANYSEQKTSGVQASQDSSFRAVNVNLSNRFGRHATGSLGLRRTQYEGTVNPYTENAIIGNLSLRF